MPQVYNDRFHALGESDTVGHAIEIALENRLTDLPVVDDRGRLAGLLTVSHLLGLLLPKAALLGDALPDLAFVQDTPEQLAAKLAGLANHEVSEFMAAPEHVAHPDTAVTELVLLLQRGAGSVPVVERDTRRLVGMVSARDILTALRPGGGR